MRYIDGTPLIDIDARIKGEDVVSIKGISVESIQPYKKVPEQSGKSNSQLVAKKGQFDDFTLRKGFEPTGYTPIIVGGDLLYLNSNSWRNSDLLRSLNINI